MAQGGTARGAVVIGAPDLAGMLAQLVARRMSLELVLSKLEHGDWSGIAARSREQERKSA